MGQAERAHYAPAVAEAAAKWGIPASWLDAVLNVESRGYDPNVINGSEQGAAGDTGIAQFIPETARQYGVNARDPYSSIDGAAHFLSDLLGIFKGNQTQATAAYNAGPGNVGRAIEAADSSNGAFHWTDLIPAGTQRYLGLVFADAQTTPAPSAPRSIGLPSPGDIAGGLITGASRILDPHFWAKLGLTLAAVGMVGIGLALYLHEDIERVAGDVAREA